MHDWYIIITYICKLNIFCITYLAPTLHGQLHVLEEIDANLRKKWVTWFNLQKKWVIWFNLHKKWVKIQILEIMYVSMIHICSIINGKSVHTTFQKLYYEIMTGCPWMRVVDTKHHLRRRNIVCAHAPFLNSLNLYSLKYHQIMEMNLQTSYICSATRI